MVGPNGGSVSRLFFAVIGDTRPANVDDTGGYPTTVIENIYSQVSKLNPQFVITTGDYMFSTPAKNTAPAQMALYTKAAQQFKGPIFAAMGNHECNGYTDSNCAGAQTTNFNSYYDSLVAPLGQKVPYYTVPINDLNNQWTAKIIVAACNDWDATQSNWLKGELARATTYTFVVRHEPLGTAGAPCVSEMDNLLSQSKYDLFIVGHSHTFAHSQKQLTVGNGGAPLTGNVGYGYAIIEQQNAGFLISQYDVMSPNPVATFTVQ
jgi:predicted phosphodiesterase